MAGGGGVELRKSEWKGEGGKCGEEMNGMKLGRGKGKLEVGEWTGRKVQQEEKKLGGIEMLNERKGGKG